MNNVRVPWTAGRPVLVRELLSLAAERYRTTPPMILSGSKERNICEARWHVIWELRIQGFSTPRIGKWLGGMHHTTILHALEVQAKKIGPYGSMKPLRPLAPYDPDQPDESGVWV